MKKNQIEAVKSVLGQDIFESLEKSDIMKPITNTAVSPQEVQIALQIVPRTVLAFLYSELKDMKINEAKDIEIPFGNGAKLDINKLSPDVYSGYVYKDGKKLVEFKYRPLPSIGLVLMSTFELYELEDVAKIDEKKQDENKVKELQSAIEERLALHKLVEQVVDKKISERDALDRIINDRIQAKLSDMSPKAYQEEAKEESTEEIENDEDASVESADSTEIENVDEILEDNSEEENEDNKEDDVKTGQGKLWIFLNEKKKKKKKKHESVEKAEIKCKDCDSCLYKSGSNHLSLCVCYGNEMNQKIKVAKKEGKFVFDFPNKFSAENIEMLIKTLDKSK